MRIPKGGTLPADFGDIKSQVGEWFPKPGRDEDGEWIDLQPAARLTQYVDPTLPLGLSWWEGKFGKTRVRDLLLAQGKHKRVRLSISDAWTAHTLANVMAREAGPIVVLQADDHRDLSTPFIRVDAGAYEDLISGRLVDVAQPDSVKKAILSGAIGMGGWLTLPARESRLSIRRLRNPRDSGGDAHNHLEPTGDTDALFGPNIQRAGIALKPRKTPSRHFETADPRLWIARSRTDELFFVHIDADYFCNRFDWDSDWQDQPQTNDHDRDAVERSLEEVIEALESLGQAVAGVHIAMSPGFFPGEYWALFNDDRLDRFNALIPPKPRSTGRALHPRVGQATRPVVTLEPHKTMRLSWVVLADGLRAGTVRISPGEDDDWTIFIKINRDRHGQGIGSWGYRLAVEQSGLPVVWAHIRKNNPASVRAAENAGFVIVDRPGERQLVLKWTRARSKRRR